MALAKTVIIVIVVLVVLYLVLRWAFQSSTQLSHVSPGTRSHHVKAKKLGKDSGSGDFTYSTWFYVEDWNKRYGENKMLLARASSPNWGPNGASPLIYMDAKTNNLAIEVQCFPTPADANAGRQSTPGKCGVENFPLQRWVNLIISVYGRTLDVYIDGKLFRTCVLPNVAKVNPLADIFITPGGGFFGYTGNFQYWSQAVNPQQAYNIYKTGYGGNWLSNLFNKYRLRIQFLEGSKVHGSFEI
tara:strand:- start:2031 stop:2759 length:729 start_codon:yes stop_codon:yes gene_type:complete